MVRLGCLMVRSISCFLGGFSLAILIDSFSVFTVHRKLVAAFWASSLNAFTALRTVLSNFQIPPVPEIRVVEQIHPFIALRASAIKLYRPCRCYILHFILPSLGEKVL